jgi:hypothetical protein
MVLDLRESKSEDELEFEDDYDWGTIARKD